MKNFMVILLTLFFSLGIVAQVKKQQKNKTQDSKTVQMRDRIHMKDGKMMMMENGKWTMMQSEMTMPNGCVVYPNGMVKMKDGKTMMMKNGDRMDRNGMMMGQMREHIQMKDGKMMMLKNGKWTMMESEMTMPNGCVVYPNGMVKMKDGKTRMMKNGERMDGNGMMMKQYKKEK